MKLTNYRSTVLRVDIGDEPPERDDDRVILDEIAAIDAEEPQYLDPVDVSAR